MKFLRNLLAVLVGLTLFTGAFFLIMIGVISAIGTAEPKVTIESNSVLKLNLNRPIVERTVDDPFADLGILPGLENALGVLDVKRAIQHAKNDDNIKGIYLDCGSVMAGYASLEEIRNDLKSFKESGKFVVSYSEMYGESGYYLASVADEVMSAKEAPYFEFNGINYTAIFLKGLFDKLDIEPEIYRVGEFKSAVEPFMRKDMSAENRMQVSSFIGSIYRNMLSQIADSRDLAVSRLQAISDSMLVFNATDAVEYGLIDATGYYDEAQQIVRERMELDEDENIRFIEIEKYIKAADPSSGSLNRIAVVVAEGEIVSGEGENQMVGSERFVKAIRQAREDKSIKAVVLRINSPGGSGLASDVIWREVALTKKEKPVIASMSDLAASGGYYIAMGCDTIVANPGTITGSIGVFGLMLNMQDFFDNKLGITSESVNTGEYSDIFTMMRPHNQAEKARLQSMVDDFYQAFIEKAAEGRDMSPEEMHEIAQGRVWTGEQALENGLVDVLGGYEDALALAAEKAGIEDYQVRYYPKQKTFIEQLFEGFGSDVETMVMKKKFGEYYYYLEQVNALKRRTGVQARMPFDLRIQ